MNEAMDLLIEQEIANAYNRGYHVAYQRAISRQELGLPLEIGKRHEDGSLTLEQTEGVEAPYGWMAMPVLPSPLSSEVHVRYRPATREEAEGK